MINNEQIANAVKTALAEDIGAGDVTSVLLPHALQVTAKIISREAMLLCGRPWVDAIFHAVDPHIVLNWLEEEGAWLDKPATLVEIKGSARHILTAERTALNFLQTLSGTATQTHRYLDAIAGYETKLLDTRKTLPGLRYAQKYAVATAGGVNHRMGLYDAYLIKENHIKACGSISNAVRNARQKNNTLLIEVEVETLDELQEALDANPDRIMLDNFSVPMIHEAMTLRGSSPCSFEVSGGITLESIVAYAKTGVDYISIGNLTKSVQAIDLSLLIV